MLNQRRINFILRLNLALAFTEGLLVLWSFLKEPSEAQSAAVFGFSYLRLVLIGIVFFSSIIFLILFLRSFGDSGQKRGREFLAWLANQKWIAWAWILWMATAYVLLFLSKQQLGSLAAYRERLFPILLWLIALSIQFGLGALALAGIRPAALRDKRQVFARALVILILMGLLLLAIAGTRIGLVPDYVYWQGPGVPILLSQVLLAASVATLFFLWIERTPLGRSTRLDLIVFLCLWGIACFIWLIQPAKLTYFSLAPGAPNFQTYPFSDSLIYDSTAREFLIGKPIPGDLWVKPIYALFLAFLHLFAGNNYTLLSSLQVIILAVIPSFMYLLTTVLDKRSAGLAAALLVILRERNAMALSNVIQVSHSKLLLSDVFAMGEMVILVWLVVWWLQRPVDRRAVPIAAGGMLGLLILTRGHTILMIPFLFLVSFIVLKPNFRLWYESSWRITLGLFLVLLPWFLRVYASTGKLAFQDPASPYAVNDTLVKLYSQPSTNDSASYGEFQSQVFKSFFAHPLDIAYLTSTHYFHNLIFSYVYLPGSFQIEDLNAYVKRQPFWNYRWDGSMPTEAWGLMVLNFAALALGISIAWKKANRVVFVPILLGAAYNLSIAVTRRSGWRFILPADWVTLIFYAVGLIGLITLVQSLVKQPNEPADRSDVLPQFPAASRKYSPVLSGLPFLLISVGLVLGHKLFPFSYPVRSADELLGNYESALKTTSETDATPLKTLIQNGDAAIVYGKALYPVYFKANRGMINYNWLSFSLKPYNRLAFYLIGSQSYNVNLPLSSPPNSFPDGSNVIVIGCLAEAGEIDAVSVLIQGPSPVHYLSEPFPAPDCPVSGVKP